MNCCSCHMYVGLISFFNGSAQHPGIPRWVLALLHPQWRAQSSTENEVKSHRTTHTTADVLKHVQEAVAHSLLMFRFMLEHMSTTYLAYWAPPRGFTELRACIHLASQDSATQNQDHGLSRQLQEGLGALNTYLHSSKFRYLRSKVSCCCWPVASRDIGGV